MNDFCLPFDHDFVLPTKEDIFPNGKFMIQKKFKADLLDKKIIDWLAKENISISWIEVAYKIPLPATIKFSMYGNIHSDGIELDDKAKINFIIGGQDSRMIWYKTPDHYTLNKTSIRTDSLRPDTDDLEEIHSASFSAALVNAGKFHSVENEYETRIAIQCIINDSITGERLQFPEARSRLIKLLKPIESTF